MGQLMLRAGNTLGQAMVFAMVLFGYAVAGLPPATAMIDYEPADYPCDHPGSWECIGTYDGSRFPEYRGRPLWSWACDRGCTPVD